MHSRPPGLGGLARRAQRGPARKPPGGVEAAPARAYRHRAKGGILLHNFARGFGAVAAAAALSVAGASGTSARAAAGTAAQAPGMSARGISPRTPVPGTQLWVKRYNGPGNSDDGATSLAVGPGGGRVFVTGASANDYATVAYSAATGAQLWVKRYDGPSNPAEDGGATSVAASPGGRIVFVTGTSSSAGSPGTDYATVAYSAATGAQLWAEHYSGSGAASSRASSVAVSPDGKELFVTGASTGAAAPIRRSDYATLAYSASTGAQLWAKRYNGPGNKDDGASSVAVSPAQTQCSSPGQHRGDLAY